MMAQPQGAKEPIRTQVRTPSPVLKKGEYRGRDGEILRRDNPRSANPFDFPESVKEKGWSYQWIRADVLGSSDFSEVSVMRRAGWREVKPSQLNGFFERECPGADCIERGGLVLMERPEQMTRDAQDEQLREANRKYAAQVNKRADADSPLPPGVVPMLREVYADTPEPNPNAHRPGYASVTAPAEDDE
jgi:hypothetical protein